MIFSCLTWNTAKRIKHINKQVEIIENSHSLYLFFATISLVPVNKISCGNK